MDCCCAAGEGVKPTVRVKPSRRAPAEYISVSRKPPTGGLRRKSMIIAVSSYPCVDGLAPAGGRYITSSLRSSVSP